MTVAVGMSGGVDSSVTAALLKYQGYDVVGLTMKLYSDKYHNTNACFSPNRAADIEAAKRICAHLDIPHYTIDLSTEFQTYVLDYFKSEYESGRTPNPCVMCNKTIKFGLFLDRAMQLVNFDYFATGHYASVENINGQYFLKKSDTEKDQTYFLHALSQKSLSRLILPLGKLSKSEVRAFAEKFGIEVAQKKDSQDFISPDMLSDKPGDIIYNDQVVGTHSGVSHYTIGQRKGLGVAIGKPVFVSNINVIDNTITLSDRSSILNTKCEVDLTILDHSEIDGQLRARIRSNHNSALIKTINNNIVEFEDSQLAITPGQFLVVYKGEYVVGGGAIRSVV